MGLRFSHIAIAAINAAGRVAESMVLDAKPELAPVAVLVRASVKSAKAAKRKRKARKAARRAGPR